MRATSPGGKLAAALAALFLLLAGCTSSSSGTQPATSSPRRSGPPATGTTAPSSGAPATSAPSPSPAPSGSGTGVAPVPPSGSLNGLQVADLSFVGALGWALGTVGCSSGSGRCAAVAASSDNGRSWHSIRAPQVNVAIAGLDSGGCADPCVEHVRFATPAIGYLYGPSALYLTTDGGARWIRQAGGADALESLDGNVIRVIDQGGCPPGCRYSVQLSGLGERGWSTVALPGTTTTTTGVALARTGTHAYLLAFGHPAGGAQDARSTLWTSADDGRHWTHRGEPCPPAGHEVDSVALTTAPDGSATVLCRARSASAGQFTATSTDGGAHFVAGSRTALGSGPVGALAAASRDRIYVSSDDIYRSTDGGRRFARLGANGGDSPGALGWLGFASASVGHGVSVDRRRIWTTTDGGRSWRAGRLS